MGKEEWLILGFNLKERVISVLYVNNTFVFNHNSNLLQNFF